MKFGKKEMKMGPGYRGPRIAAHEKRLEQFRQTLENLAQKIANKEGVFAKFRGEFTYAEDRAVEETLKHDVAADCIHPTIKGHKAIAEVFWNNAEHLLAKKCFRIMIFPHFLQNVKTKEVTEESFGVGLDFVQKNRRASHK